MLSNLRSKEAFAFRYQLRLAGGAKITRSSIGPQVFSLLKLRIPALESHRKNNASFLKLFNKPTLAPAVSTVALAWAWRSAVNWPDCWAVKFNCAVVWA